MNQEPTSDEIRIHVRERYGSIAERAQTGAVSGCGCGTSNSACCTPEASAVSALYQIEDVSELPAEVTNISLGCGDPISLAELQPGQTVLDLGSGGGIDCFLAARRVGPGGRVIGVDMTPAMLDLARTNQRKMGVENVEFRLGEIEHLPVGDDQVDVVISNCVINLSPDKPQVFREVFRALKPGGKVAVSDIVTHGRLPEVVRESMSAWAGCISGAMEVDDYLGAMREAGFTDIQMSRIDLPEDMVEDARREFGQEFEAELPVSEEIMELVFSARITAVKPGAD